MHSTENKGKLLVTLGRSRWTRHLQTADCCTQQACPACSSVRNMEQCAVATARSLLWTGTYKNCTCVARFSQMSPMESAVGQPPPRGTGYTSYTSHHGWAWILCVPSKIQQSVECSELCWTFGGDFRSYTSPQHPSHPTAPCRALPPHKQKTFSGTIVDATVLAGLLHLKTPDVPGLWQQQYD